MQMESNMEAAFSYLMMAKFLLDTFPVFIDPLVTTSRCCLIVMTKDVVKQATSEWVRCTSLMEFLRIEALSTIVTVLRRSMRTKNGTFLCTGERLFKHFEK